MSKSVLTLTEDIHRILDRGLDHKPSEETAAKYAMKIGAAMASATLPRNKPREKGKLWASDIGKDCDRKTWYEFNLESEKEATPGSASFKFLYGNILEEAVLYFAEEAGHTVEDTQMRIESTHVSENGNTWTVSGKIDGVVDGTLLDVKSTSTYGFKKYTKEGLTPYNDSFGYRWQVSYYDAHYPAPTDQPGILWIDKQNGHISFQYIEPIHPSEVEERIIHKINVIESPEVPSTRPYLLEDIGRNLKLPIACQYCDFKHTCYPGLRTFLYSHGPVYLTEVNLLPRVPEVDKDGNPVS